MQFVYNFKEVSNANSTEKIALLGNKGAQLFEMTSIGLNVPPFFVISTQACREYFKLGKKWPQSLEQELPTAIKILEEKTNKKLGSTTNPLFVSVRSGSPVSMPGMMDTILNIGLNDKTVEAFAKQTGNELSALESYKRFLVMFGTIALKIPEEFFENNSEELSKEDLEKIIAEYKKIIATNSGKILDQDAFSILRLSINSIFNSWNSDRAIAYRNLHTIESSLGTAAIVQQMVFGNLGADSGTGVAFTRNPVTGEKELFGDFLLNAQGEDVVSGTHSPMSINELETLMPQIYKELLQVSDKLEAHYKDMQDFEFTIEKGKLFILQTRQAKRFPSAAEKIAKDFKK